MPPTALALALAVLWPQPREVGPAAECALRLPLRVAAPAELDGPAGLLRQELHGMFGEGTSPEDTGTSIRLSLDPEALARPEEYTIEPQPDGLVLRAHDVQGTYWAVHDLLALAGQARRTPHGYAAIIPRLRNWPDASFRAFMIQGAWTPDPGELERNLELLARQHVTQFALEFGPQVVLDFDPSLARGGRLSKARAREVIDCGRRLGLRPIAYLNLLGHLERAYEKHPCTQHGGIDIRNDEVYEQFVYPILSEMLEVYGPVEFFHGGMDEAWDLFRWLSQQGADPAELLARHIRRVHDFLTARGVRLVIWHDMLVAPNLQDEIGAPIGPANGGPPQNTAAALARIPPDVTLDYWFYEPLAQYPALDYLRRKGFSVWASPWQTPFALTRYAQARGVPVLGTLWAGPPGCFGSSTYSPVTALYAQAAWNAAAASGAVSPEPELRAAAQRATNTVLWRRRTLTFPGNAAVLLSPAGPCRVPWPQEGIAQFYGVPLDVSRAVRLDALPRLTRPLAENAGAAAVRLPDGTTLTLDGVNAPRGQDQLILYTAPRTRTGTNIYGAEAGVSAAGIVLEVSGYGAGDHPIPAGGFVLSAHAGPRGERYRALTALRPGDTVAVLDAQGAWVGGSAPARLLAELPDGTVLTIDGEDAPRSPGRLILYHPDDAAGGTGTDPRGVEVVVRGGRVAAVRTGAGNTRVPADGYVLSADQRNDDTRARALAALREGDAVRLLLERGSERHALAEWIAARRQVFPVGMPCNALYLAVSSATACAPGTRLGQWVVRYANGSSARFPVRCGREALAAEGEDLPQRTGDPVWLVDQPPLRFLVREWPNPHPTVPVAEIGFEPACALFDTGVTLLASTAAVP